jgi:hypothetical protein
MQLRSKTLKNCILKRFPKRERKWIKNLEKNEKILENFLSDKGKKYKKK